ncbi:PREDICTED: uncharacterized protein LOC104599470 [Nelumbo nucifera]|uniref:Uncharacterized protein LOC104599470 n=1 Tax=Nelumbo nucifera TaxID=4432 RepID=A0A1U8ADN6_NELNU|nr:PREDICTED: uncharacterized protein LOC104599470 [Nelumbo nucifera]
MAVNVILLLLSVAAALSGSTPLASQLDSETVCGDQNNDLICELQRTKLKISRLESILEESIKILNAKIFHLEEQEKLIEEMSHKIILLQSSLLKIKGDSSYVEERVNALEEEVRLLWDASRKNNFKIHILEYKAQDEEERLEVITSQYEKMADIVTEQWIQIQQLEQALHIAERTLTAQRKVGSYRWRVTKFIKDFCGHYLQKMIRLLHQHLFDQDSVLGSCLSEAWHQLKRTIIAAKKYHHELQVFVKHEMERNEFTAAIANQEVVFFVASALITFPVISTLIWLLPCFG